MKSDVIYTARHDENSDLSITKSDDHSLTILYIHVHHKTLGKEYVTGELN